MATSKANNNSNNINKPSTKLGHNYKTQYGDSNAKHYSNGIRTTLNTSAYKANKFDWFQFRYNDGYPFSDFYSFCKQRLSMVYQYGSSFTSKATSENNHYPQMNISNSVYANATSGSCELPGGGDGGGGTVGCVNVPICTPPSVFDPVSCQCVTPPLCVPNEQESCTPVTVPNTLQNIIKGYAVYVDSFQSIPIPDIGSLPVKCAGGHYCNRTIFMPQIDGLNANKTINLNNGNTGGDRFDTFEFVLNDPSTQLTSSTQISLDCRVAGGCHTSVVMIYLVGYSTIDNSPLLLFASCLNGTISKPIGTIDCGDGEPCPCDNLDCGIGGPPGCAPISSAVNITISYPDFDMDKTLGPIVQWPPYSSTTAPQCQASYESDPGYFNFVIDSMRTPLTHTLNAGGASQVITPVTYGSTNFIIVDNISWFPDSGILYTSRSLIALQAPNNPIYNQLSLSSTVVTSIDPTSCQFNLTVGSINSYNQPAQCYIGTQAYIVTTS